MHVNPSPVTNRTRLAVYGSYQGRAGLIGEGLHPRSAASAYGVNAIADGVCRARADRLDQGSAGDLQYICAHTVFSMLE